MAVDRLQMLRKLVADRPGDPFPAYGLAMELRRLGQMKETGEAFDALLSAHPEYVPAYLMAGQHQIACGDRDKARDVLGRGLTVARAAGDGKAAGELADALSTV